MKALSDASDYTRVELLLGVLVTLYCLIGKSDEMDDKTFAREAMPWVMERYRELVKAPAEFFLHGLQ